MHRGHLDPSVATLPLPAERGRALIERQRADLRRAASERDPGRPRRDDLPNVARVGVEPVLGGKRSATRARSHEHNLAGSPGTQIVPELYAPADIVVATKKRYSAYLHTDLEFVLRDLGAKTVLLAGVNTNSCVLCTSFETVNPPTSIWSCCATASTRWTARRRTAWR